MFLLKLSLQNVIKFEVSNWIPVGTAFSPGQSSYISLAITKNGKPIMVLPSTATLKDGTIVSRIVPYLQPGTGVVVTRGDVHYVATEWGLAYLYGKSIRERVLEMINIAHPDFREELLKHAKKWSYVYSDQALPVSIDESRLQDSLPVTLRSI